MSVPVGPDESLDGPARGQTTNSLEEGRLQVAAQQVKLEHGSSSADLAEQLQDRCL